MLTIAAAAFVCATTIPNGVWGASPATKTPLGFGNAVLSTLLAPKGTVIFKPGGSGFVMPDGALGIKWPWERRVLEKITVTGERIDAPASRLRFQAGEAVDKPHFVPSYVIFPTPGCWRLTAWLAGRENSKLTFITKVVKIGKGPGWHVATKPAERTVPAGVPADIRGIIAKPLYKNATWGLRVLDGSKVLIDLHPERKFFIGSVRKVFSVGQLLDAVGPDHRYDTPVYRIGSVNGGVLHGNLVIVASGDLTMGGRTNPDGSIAVSNWDHNEAESLGNAILTKPNSLAGYERLARAVKAAGITRIDGDVIVDDRLFQPFNFRGQFDVRPIFVNDDVVDISVTPGGGVGAKLSVRHRPVSAALAIKDQLRKGAPKSKDTLKIDPEYPKCIGTPGCSATIEGSLPADFTPPLTGTNTLVQTVRITQPSNYARTVFIESLRKAGVTVSAPAVEQNPTGLLPSSASYTKGNQVAVMRGMTYAQDAKFILKISYNIGADTSLVLFGVARGANSMPAALAVERKNLATRFGIPATDYHFVDGSGGGDTTATDRAVTTMLQKMQRRPTFSTLYNDLPILAVDGSLATVKDFEKDPTLAGAAGQIRAKTGTYVAPSASGGAVLKGQAFGGYITTKSGKHLVYQLVVNNVPITSIPDVIRVFQDEGTISAMLWRDY